MADPKKLTSPEEDTNTFKDLKASLKKATFHVEARPDRIIVYRFDNLSREVFIQWVDYARSKDGKLTPPVRMLFDFRGSGPPSRFLKDRLPAILNDLTIPADTRSAFVVDDNLNGYFTRTALESLPDTIGETRSFVNMSPAIQWLQEGLDAQASEAQLPSGGEDSAT
jgi:hypothetical protein